jgi:hypothetical protein
MPVDPLQKPEKPNGGDPRPRDPCTIDHICADTTPVVLDRIAMVGDRAGAGGIAWPNRQIIG